VTVESKYPKILWYDIQKYNVDGDKTEDMGTPPAGTTDDANWASIRRPGFELLLMLVAIKDGEILNI